MALGLAECGCNAEVADVRHLIDRCSIAMLALPRVESSVLGMKQHTAGDAAAARSTDSRRQRRAGVPKKRGRTPDTDPDNDRRIFQEWKNSGYTCYKDFALKYNYPLRTVKTAIDRHRKRVAGQRKKSVPKPPSSPS